MASVARRTMISYFAGFAVVLAAAPAARAFEQEADARAVVARLEAALIGLMKAGSATPFEQRCAMLGPVLERSFDLASLLKLAVGPRWTSLNAAQQSHLQQAFYRYNVASWVANFDAYSGQRFRFVPDDRKAGDAQVIATELVPVSGTPHRLDFVLRRSQDEWRIVDVLADGTISRIALLRSDFRALLADGTGAALAASLDKKAADLSVGASA